MSPYNISDTVRYEIDEHFFTQPERNCILNREIGFFSPVNLLKKLFIPRQETVLLSPDFAEILSRQTVVVGEGGVGRGQGPELTQSEI